MFSYLKNVFPAALRKTYELSYFASIKLCTAIGY